MPRREGRLIIRRIHRPEGKLHARNLQTPEEVGLQTLGPDNTPTLTIVIR